jgi:hypothetical protein
MARLTTLLCLLALLAPAGALAQDNPFGPIPQAPPEQQAPPEDGDTSDGDLFDDDEGISDRQQLLIIIAGGIMVLGIAFYIVRDARRNAPVEHHLSEAEGGTASKGTRAPKKQRVAQGRAKAKQARRARKRNR